MNKTLLYFCLSTATVLAPAVARSAGVAQAEAVQDLLHGDYYAIEFFVFERPRVLEFNSAEVLALNRPRSLPLAMRIQEPDPEQLWPLPIDAPTRACLTFPTLQYQLLPDTFSADTEAVSPAATSAAVAAPGTDIQARQIPQINPNLGADPLLSFMAEVAAFERGIVQNSNRWLADGFRLSAQARRVERTGLGRVLFHGRWIQAVPPREAPEPILVQAGQRLPGPPPVDELVGTVGVTLGRYLHFQADLFFHAPGLGLLPVSAPIRADGTAITDAMPAVSSRYMELSESRRMRSEEIHYLDHPKLGLLVRIDPLPIPDGLVEAFDNLKERLE